MIYLIAFIGSVLLSLITTKIIKDYSIKNKIAIKKISSRDVNKNPIPRTGGLAIFISFWIVVGIILIINPNLLNFVENNFINIDNNLFGLILASLIWLVVGLFDDLYQLKPWMKLIAQFVCGFVIVGFGIKIWWLSNPLGGNNIILGNWTYLLVPIWIVLMMNVMNWFDGVDGLTPSISLISLVVLFVLSINPTINQPATALLCIILAGNVLGFIPSNWNPAKIFLGDTGSGFLGLMLAVFAIISGAKLATAFLVLGIPILDALVVIFSRILNKKSIFAADKNHLHHKFLAAGFSVKMTVIIISAISAAFGFIALNTQTLGKVQAILWLVVLMVIILVGLYYLNKKHYGRKK